MTDNTTQKTTYTAEYMDCGKYRAYFNERHIPSGTYSITADKLKKADICGTDVWLPAPDRVPEMKDLVLSVEKMNCIPLLLETVQYVGNSWPMAIFFDENGELNGSFGFPADAERRMDDFYRQTWIRKDLLQEILKDMFRLEVPAYDKARPSEFLVGFRRDTSYIWHGIADSFRNFSPVTDLEEARIRYNLRIFRKYLYSMWKQDIALTPGFLEYMKAFAFNQNSTVRKLDDVLEITETLFPRADKEKLKHAAFYVTKIGCPSFDKNGNYRIPFEYIRIRLGLLTKERWTKDIILKYRKEFAMMAVARIFLAKTWQKTELPVNILRLSSLCITAQAELAMIFEIKKITA